MFASNSIDYDLSVLGPPATLPSHLSSITCNQIVRVKLIMKIFEECAPSSFERQIVGTLGYDTPRRRGVNISSLRDEVDVGKIPAAY